VTEYLLKVEGVHRFFPSVGNVAIDVSSYCSGMYVVSVGARICDGFKSVCKGYPELLLDGSSLEDIAKAELKPFGDKEKIFDVFINNELFRPGIGRGS